MSRKYSSDGKRFFARTLLYTALVSSGTVFGQDPAASTLNQTEESDPGNQDQITELDSVVVRGVARQYLPDDQTSATGLSMRLVETPQAITVLTSEMMQTIGANSVYEATDLIPGVQRGGVGFGIDRIMIRGLTGQPQRVNGTSITTVGTPDAYSLERAEVVRGPATVVYGVTGAFGGEINSILKRPQEQLSAEAGFEVGSFDTQRYFMDVTGALNESGTVQGRVVGRHSEFGPPIDISGVDINQRQTSFLASLAWQPTDRTGLTLWYHRTDRDIDPYDGGSLVRTPDGGLALPAVDPEDWYFSLPEQSNQKSVDDLYIGEFRHELANGWRVKSQATLQQIESDISYFYPYGPAGAYDLGDDEVYIYSYDRFTEAETLTFDLSLGGDFELGGREHSFFAAFEAVDDTSPTETTLLNSSFVGIARLSEGGHRVFADGSPWLPIDRAALGIRSQSFSESTDYKFSIQGLFNITDRLQTLAGLMYHDNTTTTRATYTRGTPIEPHTVSRNSWSKTVGRFGATYDIMDQGDIVDDARIYFSYSEGFQPQSITDADGNTVQMPREMEQYEIGFKMDFLNGRASTAVALYQYEITNIAVSSAFLGSFGGFGTTVVEGLQKATGLEFEVMGELLPGWNLAANYTYMDLEVSDPNYDFTTWPRSTPRHSGAVTTSYEFLDGPMRGFRFGGSVVGSSDYSMVDGLLNIDRFGRLVDGAYTRFDLSASYTDRNDKYLVYLNWHNVFDEKQIFSKQGHPGYGVTYTDQPSVTLGFKYKIF